MFNPVRFVTDPNTRPRAIAWLGIALIVFLIIWTVGLAGTSTTWFCTQPCHIVHDDNTLAYNVSSHHKIACVACHEPVSASPLQLTMLKIEVAPDAIKTAMRTFELPANHDDHIALEMPSKQCTQCHILKNRTVTPHHTVIINHEAHEKQGIACTICHNRVAHREEKITLILPGDHKHENWLSMNGCFRCHSQDANSRAPGRCSACHPSDMKLKPATHNGSSWYTKWGNSKGHAQAAKDVSATIEASIKEFGDRPADEATHGEIEGAEPTGELRPSSQVNTCYTCHKSSFCDACHQTQIPHTAAFKKKHADEGFNKPQVCAQCHARSATEAQGTAFCNACHHKDSKPGVIWIYNHGPIVQKKTSDACFKCHTELDCSGCHVRGVILGRQAMRKRFQAK